MNLWLLPPIVVASMLILASGYLLWKRRHIPMSRTATVLLMIGALWTISRALEMESTDLESTLFWWQMRYIWVVLLPPVWLVYTMQFTGEQKLPWHVIAPLSITSVFFILLIFTNEAHGLMWSQIEVAAGSSSFVVEKTKSLGYWSLILFSYTLVFIGAGLIFRALIEKRSFYRWQAILLLIAVLLPWMGNLLDVFDLNPYPRVDPTTLALAVTSTITVWTIYRLRRVDIAPAARIRVIESMEDGMMIVDIIGTALYVNTAAAQMFGIDASRATGRRAQEIWPEWPEVMAALESGAEFGREIVVDRDDSHQIYDITCSSLTDKRDRIASHVIVFRNITDRKLSEDLIRASLRDKEMLLKEIHHRVKNNLQVVSSLLYLQSRKVHDDGVLEMFQESQHRVRSMALVHERLYRTEDLAWIDFGAYIHDLTDYLFQVYKTEDKSIRLKTHFASLPLNIDAAIPCGLIVNELVSNALKHAFPNGKPGEINIELYEGEDGQFSLSVSDNGIGFPEDVDFRNTTSLGLQLVNTLADQIEGSVELDGKDGTSFVITSGRRQARNGNGTSPESSAAISREVKHAA